MKNRLAGRLTTVNVSELKPHKVLERFPLLPDAKYEQIKRSLHKRGLKSPLQATTSLILIDGRHRLRAAKELGWPKIDVLVRVDLKTEDEILREIFAANNERRQQSLLEQVEVLIELQRGDAEIDIAKLTGASKKQIGRLRAIVEGPPVLLQAIKNNATTGLSEPLALDVLKLQGRRRMACLGLIARGGNVRDALRSMLGSPTSSSRSNVTQPAEGLQAVLDLVEGLPDANALAMLVTRDQRAAMQAAVKLFDDVLQATAAADHKLPRLRLRQPPAQPIKPELILKST